MAVSPHPNLTNRRMIFFCKQELGIITALAHDNKLRNDEISGNQKYEKYGICKLNLHSCIITPKNHYNIMHIMFWSYCGKCCLFAGVWIIPLSISDNSLCMRCVLQCVVVARQFTFYNILYLLSDD